MRKRRIWTTSPVYYAMAAAMLVMACLSFRGNKILFAAELTAAVLAAVAVVVTDLHYRVHIQTALRAARRVLSAEEEGLRPVCAAGGGAREPSGDIVWTNARFRELFTEDADGRGDNIAAYIYPKTLRQILRRSGTAVTFGDREFTAYGLRAGGGSVVYFVDDTYYKQIHREFRDRRTVVALISFDNRGSSRAMRTAARNRASPPRWRRSAHVGERHDGRLPAPFDERALPAHHRRPARGGGEGQALRRARQRARH